MPGLVRTEGLIAIADDGRGIAPELAKQLGALGVRTEVFQSPPDDADVYGLIYLGALRRFDNAEDAISINRDAFKWAQCTGTALAANNGLFVTVQDTCGDFGLSGRSGLRAWGAGLTGLVKTARLEWPTCAVKAIDLDCGDEDIVGLVNRLVDELTAGGPEIEIGLIRDGSRITVIDAHEVLDNCSTGTGKDPQTFITSEDVIVVSGGARGVTAACMNALAEAVHPKLVLLGRTTLVPESEVTQGAKSDAELKRVLLEDGKRRNQTLTPMELTREAQAIVASREIRETIQSIEAKGAVVRYINVDVQDEEGLKQALDEVKQLYGPITGVIHAAGVIADKPILQKTQDQFDFVFNTKVRGFQTLMKLTADEPLRIICCFSSIAARAGNVGQSDYAMANEVLNRVVATQEAIRDNCVVTSIDWGAWQGGMVTPSLKQHFEHLGVPLIPMEDGAKAFVESLLAQATELVIVPDGIGRHLSTQTMTQWSMTLTVDETRYPCLHDHVIAGTPVVPVAFVIDWLVRAARACRPDLVVGSCEGLRVIKGIRLDHFSTGGHRLQLTFIEMPQDQNAPHVFKLKAEIRAEDGKLHYHATVNLTETWDARAFEQVTPESVICSAATEIITTAVSPEATQDTLHRYGRNDTEDYDPYLEHLFHGPAFYAISDVEQLSPPVVTAEFKTPDAIERMTQWNDANTVDAILLDAGLQAASLWGTYTLDRKTLPTSLRRYVTGEPGVPVRCIVVGKSATPLRTITDVYFFSADSQPLSALLGLEMHVVGGKDD